MTHELKEIQKAYLENVKDAAKKKVVWLLIVINGGSAVQLWGKKTNVNRDCGPSHKLARSLTPPRSQRIKKR